MSFFLHSRVLHWQTPFRFSLENIKIELSGMLLPYLSWQRCTANRKRWPHASFSRKWEITKAFPKNYIQSKKENLWWSVFTKFHKITKFLMGIKDLSRGSLSMRWGFSKQLAQQGWFLFSCDTAHWKSKSPF